MFSGQVPNCETSECHNVPCHVVADVCVREQFPRWSVSLGRPPVVYAAELGTPPKALQDPPWLSSTTPIKSPSRQSPSRVLAALIAARCCWRSSNVVRFFSFMRRLFRCVSVLRTVGVSTSRSQIPSRCAPQRVEDIDTEAFGVAFIRNGFPTLSIPS